MSIEAIKLALEALRMPIKYSNKTQYIKVIEAIEAAEKALAQPEQNPVGFVVDRYNGANTPSLPPTATVAWLNDNPKIGQVLYAATPPQRKPLTVEKILHLVDTHVGAPSMSYPLDNSDWINFARAIEVAHGIKE